MKYNGWEKKMTALGLAASMFMACACTGAENKSQAAADSSLAGENGQKALTITAMSQGPQDNIITNFADNEFFINLAEKTGVSIEFVHPVYGNESTEFDLMVASGDYTDLVWAIGSSTGTSPYKGGNDAAVEDGVFRDLTPYVEEYMPNYWALINSGNEEIKHMAYTDSGKIVNLVSVEYNIQEGQAEAQPAFAGLAIRKDWLDELGLEVPVTYDDWTEALTAFKDNYGCSQPLLMAGNGYWMMTQFASGYGALSTMQKNGDTIEYGPMTEGWKEYVTLMHQWYEEGLIGPEYVANDVMGVDNAKVMNNDTGATFMVYTSLQTLENGIEGGGELAAVQLPVKNEGEVAQGGANDGKVVAPKIYVTTHVSDEDLPQVLSMLDYMYSDEGMLLASYGVEGDTYTLDAEGKPDFTDKIVNNPDGLEPAKAIDAYLCPANLQLIKDWSREYVTTPEDEYEMCMTWNKDGADLIVPTLTLTSEENNTYSKAMADVETYMQEMTNNFIMGTASIEEEWDTYVQTMKDMGAEDAIAAYQAAYDRYLSK